MQNKEKEQKQPSSRMGLLGTFVLHLFRHHWGYKVLALVLAVVLWAALITQDPTLTREKTFNDVAVTVSGTDTMKRNGFIVVSDLNELLQNVTVKAAVPQRRYEDAPVSAYSVRLDLTRINAAGVHEIRIQSSSSTSYGSVTEITPSTIPVEVEEYITRYRIPVSFTLSGSVKEGWYADSPAISPTYVAISGPKSLVESISRAAVALDLSELPASEEMIRSAVPFTLIDRTGNAVVSDLLSVTSEGVLLDSVIVEQRAYPTQVMPLSADGLITGTPAAGYEIKSVSFSPTSITAAGPAENLNALDSLFASTSVDVTGANSSMLRVLNIRKPAELLSLSPGSVTVQVEIGPVIREKTFVGLKINVDGCDAGLKCSQSLATINVTVKGPQLWINSLRSSMFRVACDLTRLEEGTWEVPLTCVLSTDTMEDFNITPSAEKITVTLKAR